MAAAKPITVNDYFGTDHLRSDLRGRALRGAGITLIAQACTYAVSTAGTIIVARLLTPHDFGLVTMVLSFSLLLQNFGTNGFIEATIQREDVHHGQLSTLHWINVGINGILTLLFMASAPVIARFYKEPLLKPIVFAMALTILLGGLSNQHQALLRRKMEFNKIAACDVSATFASVVIAILLAYLGFGYWALVAKWLALPLVTAAGSWVLCTWRPDRPARGMNVGPMLRFAFNTYGNFVLLYFSKTIDKMLVGRFFGSQALGNYDRAYQFSNMLPSQLLSPLNSVAMSSFSRLSSDSVRYRHTYLTLLSTVAFITMPASAILTLTGKDLIVLLLGPQWENAGKMFSVFGFSIGVMALYYTSGWLHLSLGTPDRWLRWACLSFVATGLLFVAGLPFGPIGVAGGYSASLFMLSIPALWYAGRPIDLKISSLLSTVGKEFVSAAAAGSLSWAILYGTTPISWSPTNAIVRVLVACVLCTAVYLVLVLALHRSLRPILQLRAFLQDMLPRLRCRRPSLKSS